MIMIPDDLYARIRRSMPIPCVDLLVKYREDRVLFLKRRNPPAEGEWWFPGGRVHLYELRVDAAKRKLREECGIEADPCGELGTFDLFFCNDQMATTHHHTITTVYEFHIDIAEVKLDAQSTAYRWMTTRECLSEIRHPFLRHILDKHGI
jgi:colanic acid biosynthesis protein WcaH